MFAVPTEGIVVNSKPDASEAPILVLYGNRPQPLVFGMAALAQQASGRPVELLYLDDQESKVSIPLAARFQTMSLVRIRGKRGGSAFQRVSNGLLCIARFVKSIRRKRPHAVHAWNFDMLLAALMARITGRKFKILYTMQDTREWMISPFVRPIERWAYRAVSLVFVTSRGFENHLLRRFRLIPQKKRVVYTPNVPCADEFPDVVRHHSHNDFTIGYFGFIRGREALETLVTAAEVARSNGVVVRLLFAGIGTETDFVRQTAEEKDFVQFLGPYKHEDIGSLYAQVDALYAIYDQSYDKRIHLAYRICESINCGLPIIVAEDTHMAEVVAEYDVGVAVRFDDSEQLAAAVQELAGSPDRRKEIAENCKHARPDFVFETYEGTIRQAYAEALAG